MRAFLFAVMFLAVAGCIAYPWLPGYLYDLIVLWLFCPHYNVLSPSC